MKSLRSIARWVWFVFGLSALLLGVVCGLARFAPPARPAGTEEFTALTVERARFQGNDDRVRDRLREQQRGISRIAWTPPALADLQERHGAGWRWTWEPGDPPSRVTLQRVAPRIEEWPAYRAFVAEMAGQPGVIIESVELLAEGVARDRRFTRVAIGLRFVVAGAPSRDGPRAAPSRGPPTVAPAESSAAPRKVGASSSHRRPSTSAEPPAPETAGATFRSRPSGVQGRQSHETNNHQTEKT